MRWSRLLEELRRRPWRLLLHPPAPGAWNMAVDRALLEEAQDPVVRLYSWDPACLSLGYTQRDGWLDRRACQRLGVEIVRRPTGGRALLHEPGEITYCLVLPGADCLPLGESFRCLAAAIASALASLGAPVETARESRLPRGGGPHRACAAVIQQGEVLLEGRKFVGSAQVRRPGRLLQHGAIPRRPDPDLARRLLPDAPPAASLEDAGLANLTPGRLARALAEVLGVRLEKGDLSPAERARAEEVLAEEANLHREASKR